MDTTETYIKMADCSEIQGVRPDMVYPVNSIPTHKKGVYNFRDFTDEHGNFFAITQTDNVWLPRQDQLQEMYGDVGDCLSALYWWQEATVIDMYYSYNLDWFDSMEQLWLAFVMKKKYNKIWNDKEWIHTDK